MHLDYVFTYKSAFQLRHNFSTTKVIYGHLETPIPIIPVLTLVWMNNYIHYKILNKITYSFPNFNGAAIEVWELICDSYHIPLGMWLPINSENKVDQC